MRSRCWPNMPDAAKRLYMRKRLISTNWIRQRHPQRVAVEEKPDWTELEREELKEKSLSQGEAGLDGQV